MYKAQQEADTRREELSMTTRRTLRRVPLRRQRRRSRAPDIGNDGSVLVPAAWCCNSARSSRSLSPMARPLVSTMLSFGSRTIRQGPRRSAICRALDRTAAFRMVSATEPSQRIAAHSRCGYCLAAAFRGKIFSCFAGPCHNTNRGPAER
jgi:hypothetical protein